MSDKNQQEGLRILLTGGGTAGHVMPALAVAKAILTQDPQADLLYVGTADGLESELVRREGIPFAAIRVSAISGRRGRQAARAFVRAARAVGEAGRVIGAFRPQAALGTGGYVAGPAIAAAWLRGVPTAVHEQNLRPGLTNRWLARLVREVYISFPDTAAFFPPQKAMFTGYPVRQQIVAATRAEGARRLGLDPDRQTLLVVGGSLGARTINHAAATGLPALVASLPELQVIVSAGQEYHQALERSLADAGLLAQGRVLVFAFIHDIEHAFAAADLVISRAGGSIHELLARGLPSILVPSPNVAYDQQTENARILERAGAALLVPDRELTGSAMASTAGKLLGDATRLRAMAAAARSIGRPAAAQDIARRLLALARRRPSR
jgi:UDP-N-acetylglucosamine--N-acetylmuramyl-(pentapeptide) pyrophosphoryl-undecaprenol N-acetylglucosamine transferase